MGPAMSVNGDVEEDLFIGGLFDSSEEDSMYEPSICPSCKSTGWIQMLKDIIKWFTLARLKWILIRAALLFIFGASILITSSIIYSGFYWLYMPVMEHRFPVYFNYSPNATAGPIAIVEAKDGLRLRPGIAYDFVLDLGIPDVPGLSEQLGNFMLDLELREKDVVWYGEARPVLLPYRSALVRAALTMVKMVPILFGWAEERINLRCFLAESVISPVTKNTSVQITLGIPAVPVYEAELLVTAHLKNLRWLMYHWRLSCAALFVGLMTLAQFFSILTLFFIWRLRRQTLRRSSLLNPSPLVEGMPIKKPEKRENGYEKQNNLRQRRSRSHSALRSRESSPRQMIDHDKHD